MNLKGSIKDKRMWLIPQIWQIWVTKSYSAFHVSNKLGRKQHNFAFWKTLAFPNTLSWGSSVLCFLIFKFFMQNLFDTWLQSGWQSAIPQKTKSHIFGVFKPILTFLVLFGIAFKFGNWWSMYQIDYFIM